MTLKRFSAGGGAISKPWDVQKPCKLVLEDGSVWQGKAFGAGRDESWRGCV